VEQQHLPLIDDLPPKDFGSRQRTEIDWTDPDAVFFCAKMN